MPLKIISAAISLALGFALFIPYYRGLWKHETKPHILTWLTWSVLTALGFILSYTNGGGAGAFPYALSSLLCFSIVVYAFVKRQKNIEPIDWITFGVAVVILLFYLFTQDALLSTVFAATIDCLGYIPTFRKSYRQPLSEPVLTYVLALLSWLFSIGALSSYSITTTFYPTALVVINAVFILFLLVRRKKV